MPKFEVKQTKEGDLLKVEVTGSIDEDAVFTGITFNIDGINKVRFDFSKCETINSCGVREWIKFVKSVPTGRTIIYAEAPYFIVDQINMVANFLPKGAIVESIFVPYFCPGCQNQSMTLFLKSKEYKDNKLAAPEVKCDKCQAVMEMDVIEAKYFRFLIGV